jgi:sec-independent protein translocase protein TatB
MFDIGGLELLILGVVAIIVVGPKDLPGLLRRIGKMVAKARNMAGEFKSHFDDIADQEEFKGIREGIESVKDMSPTSQIKNALSPFEEAGSSIKDSIGGMDTALPPLEPAKNKKKTKKTTKKKAAPKAKKAAPKAKKAAPKAKASPAKAKKPVKKTATKKPAKAASKASA